MVTPSEPTDDDRREHFRVPEVLGLLAVPVAPDDQTPAAAAFQFGGNHALAGPFHDLDREGRYLLDRLAANHRDMAAVARWLDRKIELLAEAVLGPNIAGSLPDTEVELSVVGLSCPAHPTWRTGQRLALALELRPERHLLTCHARVTGLDPDRSTALLSFDALDREQQQRLTRHLLRAQGRARREPDDDTPEAP